MTVSSTNPEQPTTLYCANHPNRETMLRCNKCNKPICGECAVLTPTGYRCKDCVRGIQKRFDNAKSLDYILGLLVAGILSLAGSFIPTILGFFTIFVAPIIGVIIVAVVQRVNKHRRSQSLFLVIAGATAVGSLPLLIFQILQFFHVFTLGEIIGVGWLGLVWQGLYTFLITSTVYYRISGIQL
jgi:B-box zinc finger